MLSISGVGKMGSGNSLSGVLLASIDSGSAVVIVRESDGQLNVAISKGRFDRLFSFSKRLS